MKRSLIVLAALACLGIAEGGDASEQRFYVGADVAAVLPAVDKSDGINFGLPTGSVHVPPESIRFDGSEFGWSALFGYRVNRYLSAEVAYLDFGSIDVAETFDLANALPVPVEPGEFTFDFNLRVYGPMASLLGTLPFAGKYEAFARAGVLWASQEVPLSPQFKLTKEEELWALGLGLRAQLSSGWSARLEYQRFDDMPGTEVSGDLRLERLLLGATYEFGGSSSSSQGTSTHPHGVQNGFYAVADLGVAEPAVGKSDGFLISFSNLPGVIFHVRPSAVTFEGSDPGGGVTLGYRINRNFAAELAYTDYGQVDIREHYVVGPIDSPFLPFSIPRIDLDVDLTSRVAGPSLSILGILPVADGFEVFARAGILFADQDVSRNPADVSDSNAEKLAVWGAGMDVEITDRWSVRVAYENLEDLRRTEFTGPIRLERFVFGVAYDF
jgi:opacity protein-like surface antigen